MAILAMSPPFRVVSHFDLPDIRPLQILDGNQNYQEALVGLARFAA